MTLEEYTLAKNKFFSLDKEQNIFEAEKILNHIYSLESNAFTKDCCVYITEQLHLILRYNFFIVNYLFENIDFKLLSSWSLIPLLRNTYWYRNKLSRWYDLLNHTIKYYDFYYLNKKDLFGLY